MEDPENTQQRYEQLILVSYVQTISPTYANHVLSHPQAYLPVMIQQSQGGKKKWYHEVEGKDMIVPIITFGAE